MPPSFHIEKKLGAPQKRIAGCDEVGRGALAGDVFAAAAILNAQNIPRGLDDSKKLSRKQRETIYQQLLTSAEIGIGHASAAEIDQIGIVQAVFTAMRRALNDLPNPPDYVIIDGPKLPEHLPYPAQAIIGGDRRALSIAAASVIAKVSRDKVMRTLAKHHPLYGWQTNVGYGTAHHRSALAQYGPTRHHRRSFKTSV